MVEESGTVESVESSVSIEPQLYAGKFKSVEDLEKGYKESLTVHLKNKELERQLNDILVIPEEYKIPDGVKLRDSKINEIKDLAKRAGLNQKQFSEAVNKYNEDTSKSMKALEDRMNSIGEEKINLVKGYVENRFAEFDDSFRVDVINRVIRDEKIMEKVMSDREKDLNSSVPGANQVSSSAIRERDMKAEKLKAALQCKLDPRDSKRRDHYINICRDIAYAKRDGR